MGIIRERVFHVAEQILIETDYRQVNTRYIAKKAAVTEGTVCRLFGDKDTLINSVLRQEIWLEVHSEIFSRWFISEGLWAKLSRIGNKAVLSQWYAAMPNLSSSPILKRILLHEDGRRRIYQILLSLA